MRPNGDIYCAAHAKSATQGAQSSNQYNESSCGGCYQSLSGVSSKDIVLFGSTANVPWHRACVKCNECGVSLATSAGSRFFEAPDLSILCENDYINLHANKCSACNQVIEGSCLQASHNDVKVTFHPQCFACSVCGEELKSSPFFLHGEPPKLFCQQHLRR